MNETKRSLTEQDVIALVNEIEKRVRDHFYKDIGRGVWGMLRRALIIAVVAIAAYGSIQGVK